MDALKTFIALLALINPLGVLPMFISLTQGHTAKEKQRTIRTAALTVIAVVTVCALLGEQIIAFFGISTASLQVAGGLLILQLLLGVATFRLRLQVEPLTVSHQAIGATLLGTLVVFTVLSLRDSFTPTHSPNL